MSHAHSCTETGSTQAQTSNNPQDIAAFKKQQRRQRKAALKPGDEFPLGPNLFAEFSLVPLALDRSNILAPRETKVWAYIYRWLRTTGEAFPGYDRIAQNVGVSRRQTIRLVKSLERKAFLRSSPRWMDGRQTSNQYQLLWHEVFAKDDRDMESADFRGETPRDSAQSTHVAANVTPEGVAHVTPEGDPDVTLYREELKEKKVKEQELASGAQTSKNEPTANSTPQRPVVSHHLPERKPPQVETQSTPVNPSRLTIVQIQGIATSNGLLYINNRTMNDQTAANIAEVFSILGDKELPAALGHFARACQQLGQSNRARSWGLVVMLAREAVRLAEAGELYDRKTQPRKSEAPFTAEELQDHLLNASDAIRFIGGENHPTAAEAITTLEDLAANAESWMGQLEKLERRLWSLEDNLVASLRAEQSAEDTAAKQNRTQPRANAKFRLRSTGN